MCSRRDRWQTPVCTCTCTRAVTRLLWDCQIQHTPPRSGTGCWRIRLHPYHTCHLCRHRRSPSRCTGRYTAQCRCLRCSPRYPCCNRTPRWQSQWRKCTCMHQRRRWMRCSTLRTPPHSRKGRSCIPECQYHRSRRCFWSKQANTSSL